MGRGSQELQSPSLRHQCLVRDKAAFCQVSKQWLFCMFFFVVFLVVFGCLSQMGGQLAINVQPVDKMQATRKIRAAGK